MGPQPSLIASGRFYPPKSNTPEDRLCYYASRFPLVEVDSSYYAMPKPEVAQLWTERTPQDFTFNMKAFRLFTGDQTSTAALPKDIAAPPAPVSVTNRCAVTSSSSCAICSRPMKFVS